ncbi:MAG: Sua5/YciO/YrdC/YwlC family protein [Tahibacter sp.]
MPPATIPPAGARSDAETLVVAADVLHRGGVVAYPTESVYGLGCDPRNRDAVARLFAVKQRPPDRGVLLIAANFDQIASYIERDLVPFAAMERVRASWPGPHTWVLPRSEATPSWIARGQAGIALRVTAHPLAAALCLAFGGAIVSTSANRHADPPARSAAATVAYFGSEIDLVIDGLAGGLERPTPIRDAISGEYLRS